MGWFFYQASWSCPPYQVCIVGVEVSECCFLWSRHGFPLTRSDPPAGWADPMIPPSVASPSSFRTRMRSCLIPEDIRHPLAHAILLQQSTRGKSDAIMCSRRGPNAGPGRRGGRMRWRCGPSAHLAQRFLLNGLVVVASSTVRRTTAQNSVPMMGRGRAPWLAKGGEVRTVPRDTGCAGRLSRQVQGGRGRGEGAGRRGGGSLSLARCLLPPGALVPPCPPTGATGTDSRHPAWRRRRRTAEAVRSHNAGWFCPPGHVSPLGKRNDITGRPRYHRHHRHTVPGLHHSIAPSLPLDWSLVYHDHHHQSTMEKAHSGEGRQRKSPPRTHRNPFPTTARAVVQSHGATLCGPA